ncbi:hypothetical protein LEP1GSC161_0305 [Leptospira santarosai str. CBC1416]|uniref:Uncharacterized protein n=1 Tax=Leptospira santarosai str. CBC1416 TaxID=1193059 RepID=M6VNK5_9LEPT|nr:hypothetical protein LEP1GSC175_1043 [Leptospira santarosai str. HAI821]EMO56721.1 hypothetical protein LEP1GSC161_0305 [Leptospira santarosai str. CBC1416]
MPKCRLRSKKQNFIILFRKKRIIPKNSIFNSKKSIQIGFNIPKRNLENYKFLDTNEQTNSPNFY